jgi:hypothetical protein
MIIKPKLTEEQLLQISMIPIGKSIWMKINKMDCLILAKKFKECQQCFLWQNECRLSNDVLNVPDRFCCPCNLEERVNRKMFSLSFDVFEESES